MIIRFTKGKHKWKKKPDTLTCMRKDGSVTWSAIPPGFVPHDFAHYVVETTFGLQNSFYGLVAKGYDIAAFSEPKGKRPFEIPHEAGQTEAAVGMLQSELWESFPEQHRPETLKSVPLLENITLEQINRMRTQLRVLVSKWERLPPGESMQLTFKLGEVNYPRRKHEKQTAYSTIHPSTHRN